ncbi:hypothetical protein SCHPADRAFT_942822 [Schizopora paradoxa]|uniref:FAD-binding domain-containing protein n=1 Tax=Schizopora paradoxa TaxID=27342 RepID=A0A0H2S0C5_9AGAM|nr:hypothetical protein SCHPADRAFT_942822 [Schizopora paradoxa]
MRRAGLMLLHHGDLHSQTRPRHLIAKRQLEARDAPSNDPGAAREAFNDRFFCCKLIVSADGIRSFVRLGVVGRPPHAQSTGDAAYRAVIPTSLTMDDAQLRKMVERPEMTRWIGPGRDIVSRRSI